MSQQRDHESGFTLLEVLLALTLTAIISVLVLEGVGATRLAWDRLRTASPSEELEFSAQRLRELLRKARPVFISDVPNGPGRLLFDGSSGELTFVSLSEGYALSGGLVRLRIEHARVAKGSKETLNIGLRADVFRARLLNKTEDAPISLFRNLSSFGLRYYGQSERGQQDQWHDNWLGKRVLPKVIEAKMVYKIGDQLKEMSILTPVDLATEGYD
jgi:prepilin-type N-terminal cleavage/methylation domain-containing protein